MGPSPAEAAHPDQPRPALTAYRVSGGPFDVVPAAYHRPWMDHTPERFAYRCLPMVVANQAGWSITAGAEVRARWNGGVRKEDVQVLSDPAGPPAVAGSHFGSGILTWHIPYLFRTPPGYNLLVRGPANWPLDGASPLEGIVEADWSVATFTMNWQLTRPDCEVVFPKGFPVAMIVPQPRYDLERFDPAVRAIASDPDLELAYRRWSSERERFNEGLQRRDPTVVETQWQRHYFHGTSPSGTAAPQHQVKLNLRPFTMEAPS
ncbi:MAG TPA: DUF6065 family protein [Thermoanaerobaculia bacterium]|nr:DUF6065 family protein [Thermoanaerobaculia bacterium]